MNDYRLIYKGINARLKRAYERRQWWKMERLNDWKFWFSVGMP